jgi:capsular polysaccharide transport system ATP-binding protein
MSIELIGVSKAVGHGRARRPLFRNIDFWMENTDRVALLGMPGSGKTTLLNVICGSDVANEGIVKRDARLSWPIPDAGFLAPFSTVATNIRFIARLYGVDANRFVEDIADLAEVGPYLNHKFNVCPRWVRAHLSFAMGTYFDVDTFVFDGRVIQGNKQYREHAEQILESRGKGRGLLLATGSASVARIYCEKGFVIDDYRLTYYDNMKDAIAHFATLDKDAMPATTDEEEIESEEVGSESDM